MNRPRLSILKQFDPLISEEKEPATPTALDSDHEDGSDFSDKENAIPAAGEISMCTFFTKGCKTAYPTPIKLTKRLIDVGDVTINGEDNGPDCDSEEGDADDENGGEFYLPMTPKPRSMIKSPISTPRTPLADITTEDVSPLPRQKKSFQSHYSPQIVHKSLESPPLLPHSSLSFVINAVNSTGAAFGKSQASTTKPGLLVPNNHPSPSTPEIQVYSPEEDLGKSESLLNRVPAPFTMSEIDGDDDTSGDNSLLALPIPRASPVNTSSGDPIRQSFDLHASFQLQFQSPESSFDLLNDKISFLEGHSKVLSSFSLDEDGDHQEENSEPWVGLPQEDEEEEDASITPTNMTPEKLPTSDNTSPAIVLNDEPRTPVTPTPSYTSAPSAEASVPSTSSDAPEVPSPVAVEVEVPTILAPLAAERGTLLSTPGYRNSVPYVPPVPALRIVKRTKRYDTHLSKPSLSAAHPPLCASPVPPEVSEAPQRPQVRDRTTSPPTTVPAGARRNSLSPVSDGNDGKSTGGPVRPAPTRASQPIQPAKPGAPMPMRVAPPPASSSRQHPLAQRSGSSASKSSTTVAGSGNGAGAGLGPRRVLVPEPQPEQVHVNVVGAKPAPGVLKRPEPAPGRAAASGTVVSTRSVSVSASGVPRPVAVGSRLPAPTSGIARFRGTAPSAVPIRGIPAPRRFT
ncbi:hypothetical protein AAF712_000668 [Marasmius tenuissimus]|uniref:Uncharacterized protein n=1 Tax=Marasmius tenuissimus TaxID=585030 RepID=A0ABR3AED0_9AGAR